MIRSLVKIALLLLVAILVYNRFFGTDEEKEQSKKVFGQMRGVVTSVAGIVRSERDKFDHGKYDKVMDKLGEAYTTVREKAQYVDEKVIKRLDELEGRKAQLERQIESLEAEPAPTPEPTQPKKGIKKSTRDEELKASKAADLQKRRAELQREMERLIKDSEEMLQDAEKQE
jgi:type II secretory pathway component PulM